MTTDTHQINALRADAGRSRPRLPVLMYHSVRRASAGEADLYAVEPEMLRQHLRALRAAGGHPVPLRDGLRQLKRGNLPPLSFAVTFDDGYRDFVVEALPILDEFRVPAVAFVVSGHIGGVDAWLRRWTTVRTSLMNAAEIRTVAAAGHEIGAHSVTHAELDLVPYREARDEIHISRLQIEQSLGASVRLFAYPYGYQNKLVRNLARAAGYEWAVAVSNRTAARSDDPMAVPRFEVKANTTSQEVVAMLTASRSYRLDQVAAAKHAVWRAQRGVRTIRIGS